MKQKKIVIALFTLLVSCNEIGTITQKETTTKAEQHNKSVKIIFIGDRSASVLNAKEFCDPNPALFKPLCDHINILYTIDFRYGCITDQSNISFIRYYAPCPEHPSEDAGNPWLDKKKADAPPADNDWNAFETEVNKRLASKPSQQSDIVTILQRSLLAFGESNSETRKILILQSDCDDTFKKDFPTIPQDIEVVVIGVLPDKPLEKQFNTKVARFENLNACLNSIYSSFKISNNANK